MDEDDSAANWRLWVHFVEMVAVQSNGFGIGCRIGSAGGHDFTGGLVQ
jgi:hypothetical protein